MNFSALAMITPYVACAGAYVVLTALILLQARRSRTGVLLAAAAGTTVLWAAATAWSGAPLQGMAGALDLVRAAAWYGFCLYLYRRALALDARQIRFTVIGVAGLASIAVTLLLNQATMMGPVSLLSPGLLLRLTLAICQLLLLENLYRSTLADQRWHIGLACIALGGLAAYDVAVCADAVLLRAASPTLVTGRALVAVLVTPLLAVAAARNRNWQVNIHVSRTAVFHTATLVVSGVFLLALAAAGEVARRLDMPFGVGWGSLAEICLIFVGMITVTVMLTSGSARGTLRSVLVDHFFTHRYDYRREWQRCIDTLSKPGPLSERVISAVANSVDSGAGLLFIREPGQTSLAWAGAWNTRPTGSLPEHGALTAALAASEGPLVIDTVLSPAAIGGQLGASFIPWLGIPLRNTDPVAPAAIGYILLARPRAAFRLDAEVFDLLRILAHEVTIHLVQERATSALMETRDLRAYGERFAFVAHDIKNVSSQLSLLLSNAETYLADPEFQRDMLATVRASVNRIGGLIRRLEPTQEAASPVATEPTRRLDPVAVLGTLVAEHRRSGDTRLVLEAGPPSGLVEINMEEVAFQAAVTHLLNNAVAAAGPTGLVRLGVRTLGARVVVDVTDDGPGMSAEFIRDELFTPFVTRTEGGSGLGAFQARELLRAAGGALTVLSQPGRGTTMCLVWPRAGLDRSATDSVNDLVTSLPQTAA